MNTQRRSFEDSLYTVLRCKRRSSSEVHLRVLADIHMQNLVLRRRSKRQTSYLIRWGVLVRAELQCVLSRKKTRQKGGLYALSMLFKSPRRAQRPRTRCLPYVFLVDLSSSYQVLRHQTGFLIGCTSDCFDREYPLADV
jgi:hypothetical protein